MNERKMEPQNIILYGPPGTGKTYSTTRRALELLGEENIDGRELSELKSRFREYQEKGQIEFVTFHQSYGYEEFVEGLRPVLDDAEGEDVRYELHDGVFKRIALRAAEEGDFGILWNWLMEEIKKTDKYVVKSKSKSKGKDYQLDAAPRSDTIRAENIIADGQQPLHANKKNSEELWKNYRKDPEDLQPDNIQNIVGTGVHGTAMWIVYKCLWELSHSPDRVQKALDDHAQFKFPDSSKQYVLIIDEINRGNMSKILGELITLLEPDKRLGADNELKLRLPYSQAYFGVPPNLHILGTMNTADRSIALMDVALRRRFTFEELMPDEEVIRKNLPNDNPLTELVIELFNTLNKRIRFLYDRDHQLGHAYFLNVNSLEDLRLVFVNRVIPLLQEYFYGDWHKICIVLGCPYDEAGEKRPSNEYPPIIKAEKFREVDTLGFNHDEYEDRVDFFISPDFLKDEMTDDKTLALTFLGVLPDKSDKSDIRLDKLTGNRAPSNAEEGGEEKTGDN